MILTWALFRSTHLKVIFNDFELESTNLSKSDFVENPKQSRTPPRFSKKLQFCSIKYGFDFRWNSTVFDAKFLIFG